MSGLKDSGIDLSQRGAAVQDAVWSSAVQLGAGNAKRGTGAVGMFQKALAGRDIATMSDKDIVTAIQDYEIANNDKLFASSSAAVRAGTAKRAEAEKERLIALAGEQPVLAAGGAPAKSGAPEGSPGTQAVAQATLQTSDGTQQAGAPPRAAAAPDGVTPQAVASPAASAVGQATSPARAVPEGIAEPAVPAVAQSQALAAPAGIVAPAAPVVAAVSVPTVPAAPIADAPPVAVPMAGADARKPVAVVSQPADVGQDLRERGIAHIATGGLGGG